MLKVSEGKTFTNVYKEDMNQQEYFTSTKEQYNNPSSSLGLSDSSITFIPVGKVLEPVVGNTSKLANSVFNTTSKVYDDVELDLQNYSNSSIGIGLKHSYRGDKFDYYSKFLIYKGVGGEKDSLALQDIYYKKYVMDLGFNKYFNTSNNLKYNFYLRGQYSNDKLFGSDEISMGGVYSVRGFKNTGLSGNSGFYTRNELSMQYEFNKSIFIPYLALDYGYVKADENNIFGKIVGSSIGTRFYINDFSIELFYNIPLKDTDYTKEDSSKFLGFNIIYNY